MSVKPARVLLLIVALSVVGLLSLVLLVYPLASRTKTSAKYAKLVGEVGRLRSDFLPIVVLGTSPDNLRKVGQHLLNPNAIGLNGRWSESPINERDIAELRADGRAFTAENRTPIQIVAVQDDGVAEVVLRWGVNEGRRGFIGINQIDLKNPDGGYTPIVRPKRAPPPIGIDANGKEVPLSESERRQIDSVLNNQLQ